MKRARWGGDGLLLLVLVADGVTSLRWDGGWDEARRGCCSLPLSRSVRLLSAYRMLSEAVAWSDSSTQMHSQRRGTPTQLAVECCKAARLQHRTAR